jgi:hypothetical protein
MRILWSCKGYERMDSRFRGNDKEALYQLELVLAPLCHSRESGNAVLAIQAHKRLVDRIAASAHIKSNWY